MNPAQAIIDARRCFSRLYEHEARTHGEILCGIVEASLKAQAMAQLSDDAFPVDECTTRFDAWTRRIVDFALKIHHGSALHAAQWLGVSRSRLRAIMARLYAPGLRAVANSRATNE
jgi:DNA-binding NtrC family response regulator